MPPKKQIAEKVDKKVADKKVEKVADKPLKQQALKIVNKQGEDVVPTNSKLKIELGDGKFTNNILNISSWNVNGIRASTKNESTNTYLGSGKFDIICLNELKIDEDNFIKDKISDKFPKDYFQYMNCCKTKSGYSGVGMISKVKPISVRFDLGIPKHDGEGRVITAEFEKFNLVASYVPNAGEKLVRLKYRTEEWDVDFRKYLNDLRAKKPTILCGDLNVAHQEIDLANPGTNSKTAGFTPQERKEFTNYLESGWVDSFRQLHPKEVKYSYFSARFNARQNNKGWRLDYFVVNKESMGAVVESDINVGVVGSDHVPIELVLDTSKL